MLKLNKKRTILIGLAFFGILLVWQLYNSYCAPMLSLLFAKHDYADKVIEAMNNGVSSMKDMLAQGYLSEEHYLNLQWKVGIIMALDNVAALFLMPIFGALSDKTHTKLGKRTPYILVGSVITAIALPFIPFFFVKGMGEVNNVVPYIVGIVCSMIVVIIFMMSYRSPAVALMPDLTPKPLRSKANGIINIVGYIGGAVGAVFAIVVPVTKYINGSNQSLLMLEIPFIVCSICLLISLVLLLIKVKENKLHEELDEEIKAYDDQGESAEQVVNNDKLSKSNIRNLLLILLAEIFWFMSLNAIETFQTNYFMFNLNTSSAGGAIMTVVSGAASVVGFILAGNIADKIGRKNTILIGIVIVTIGYLVYAFIKPAAPWTELTFDGKLPWLFYVIIPIIGFGTSLIHICSFPLVTDYCTNEKLGKFTSLYYTASMLAQSVTPILIGLIFRATSWGALPIYSCVLMGIAGIVFFFVKAPHNQDRAKNAKGLEALGQDD